MASNSKRVGPFQHHYNRCVSKTWNFSGRLKTKRHHLTNAVLGIVGEAGEIADLHKKWWFHTPKYGRLVELQLELGDLLYYVTKLLALYGLKLEDILEQNYQKLRKRHPERFGGKRGKRG